MSVKLSGELANIVSDGTNPIVLGSTKQTNLFGTVNGKACATTFNGMPVPRTNATRVYVGADITNTLLYQNETAVDAFWYRVDVYAVVLVAGSAGTIQIKLEYQDQAQVQQNAAVLESALDVTVIGHAQYGSICIPMRGSHGIFYWILGTGVTGSPQVDVNFLVTEF